MSENKQGNNDNVNTYVLNQIADLLKNVSSLNTDLEKNFEVVHDTLKKIEGVVKENTSNSNIHTGQISKLYDTMSKLLVSYKNHSEAVKMKLKSLDQQMKNVVKKPRWKNFWTWVAWVLGFLGLIFSNIEHIKTLLGIGTGNPTP